MGMRGQKKKAVKHFPPLRDYHEVPESVTEELPNPYESMFEIVNSGLTDKEESERQSRRKSFPLPVGE